MYKFWQILHNFSGKKLAKYTKIGNGLPIIGANSQETCYDVVNSRDANDIKEVTKGVNGMYTAFDVANWFLQHGSMDHKKIQKLCYYTQAWSYALNNKPFFSGDFEAWVHGPVNRTVWNALKNYGYAPVKKDEFKKRATGIKNQDDIEMLNNIWETYGDLTGYELEKLTHRESPWINARVGYAEFEPSDKKIEVNDMAKYYRSLMCREGVGE